MNSDIIPLIIGTILAWALQAGAFWFLVGKIGYRGKWRMAWTIPLSLPSPPPLLPITVPIMSVTLILLLFLPWPIHQELRKLKRKSSPSESLGHE